MIFSLPYLLFILIIYKFKFHQSRYRFLLNRKSMWNLVDGNKIIGTHMKVQSYKKHLSNLKTVKSQIGLKQPFKPTFSLSKRKNKYFKCLQSTVQKQNAALLQHMIELQNEPMKKTCMNIPLSIPSNKITYSNLKNRERRHTNCELNKQNLKILNKIEGAQSTYGKDVWKEDWKQISKYKNNIVKKQFVPDYRVLVREEQIIQKSRMRPRTAMPNDC